jgi:EAL domain-containing protein (putative c-di-GMP-specific phosphodiesterase class I)
MENPWVETMLGAIRQPLGDRRWPTAVPGWVASLVTAALLGAVWLLAYAAGGSQTAVPHGFYLPIVLAGVALGARGALVTAVAAAALSGPLLPLAVAEGQPQQLSNWLVRGAFFVLVGATVGALFSSQRRAYAAALKARFEHDLDLYEAHEVQPDAAVLVQAVLEERSFHPVFQPIYSLRDGRLRTVEALTRVDTTPREPPDVWFARARQAGLEIDLDLAVMGAALDAAAGVLPAAVPLSLNCNPTTLCDARLPALLDRYPERGVILEITEHEVVDDYHEVEKALPALRARGVALAVDDTGAGFASLRHILRLGPEIIKLDISLTQGLRRDPVRRTLAECLIRFASRTGSELVAEGIEDLSDLAGWRELGADAVQGYLLGRPGSLPVAQRSVLIVEEVSGAIHVTDGIRAS